MIEPLGVAQTDDLPFNLSPPSETSKPSHAMHARLGKLTRFASANERAPEVQRARAAEAKKECCEQKKSSPTRSQLGVKSDEQNGGENQQ